MQKSIIYLLATAAILITLSSCEEKNVSCLHFQDEYVWGPYTDEPHPSFEADLEIYLKTAFPSSNCPPPSSQTTSPRTVEVAKCDPFPLDGGVPTNDCLRKEFIINNQNGGLGSFSTQYPTTIITGCDLKVIGDEIIEQLKNGYHCVCQDVKGSIVPSTIEVETVITSNSGNPANSVIRSIYVNANYRCCGPCR